MATTTKRAADDAALSFAGDVTVGLADFPVLVQTIEAVNLPKPGGKDDETIPAYEVTMKAVLPESLAAALLAKVHAHRVVVQVEDPDEVTA